MTSLEANVSLQFRPIPRKPKHFRDVRRMGLIRVHGSASYRQAWKYAASLHMTMLAQSCKRRLVAVLASFSC